MKSLMKSGRNGRIRTCDPLTPSHNDQKKKSNDFRYGPDFILHIHKINGPKGTGTPSRSVKYANHDFHNQEKGV